MLRGIATKDAIQRLVLNLQEAWIAKRAEEQRHGDANRNGLVGS